MDREYGNLNREVKKRTVVKLNVMTMGDSSIGKSCLFIKEYVSTIGIDYGLKTTMIEDREVKINFYDCAGDNVYREIVNEFYGCVDGVLVCFDSTDRLDKWMQVIRENCPLAQITLIGTKTDLGAMAVTNEELHPFMAFNQLEYHECSSLTGEGVQTAFTELFTKCLKAK